MCFLKDADNVWCNVYFISDDEKMKELKRFIRYVEARPCRFTVCRIIGIDWSLPVLVINLCVTYLIVMIQFTHLY